MIHLPAVLQVFPNIWIERDIQNLNHASVISGCLRWQDVLLLLNFNVWLRGSKCMQSRDENKSKILKIGVF